MGSAYIPEVRPPHYGKSWWLGGYKREGSKRVAAWCRHYHGTQDDAQACAVNLARLANERREDTH